MVGLIGERGKGVRGGTRIRVGRVTKEKGKGKKVVVEEAITNLYSLVEEEEEVLVGLVLEGA